MLDLVSVWKTHDLLTGRAVFPNPSARRPDKTIPVCWNHIGSLQAPDAAPGDLLRITWEVAMDSYHFTSSAFAPVGCTLSPAAAPKYHDAKVRAFTAAYDAKLRAHVGLDPAYIGQLQLPFSGENLNNKDGTYYRPLYRPAGMVWTDPLTYPAPWAFFWLALSCMGVNPAEYVELPYTGGQAALFIEVYRPRP